MKILIVSQYFWPENFRVNDLAAELSSRGHDVVVLTGWPNYPNGHIFEEFRKNPKHFTRYGRVEIFRVPLIPRGRGGVTLMLNYLSFALSAMLLGAYKLRGQKFDVVFTNQLSPVTVGIPAALIARLKKAPMAMWVLDLWPDTLHALGVIRSTRLLGFLGEIVSFIYNRCDLILAQSRSFIPKIRQLAASKQRVEYLPSWAEDTYRYDALAPAPEVPCLDGSFDIMFAGNIGESQDFPCILDAAEILKQHQNIRWLIVGDGRMTNWVKHEIDRRGLDKQVLMLGRYPVERMPSFFKRADALLVTLANQPIFSMTIPGKLQSYLTAGLPIVAALNGEGAELIRASNAGSVVPSGDRNGLADTILRLSKLPIDERRKMGQNAVSLSQQEFQRHRIIDKLEKMLGDLCLQSSR